MKVLACAVGFGLGPAGKLCSIVCKNKYEWYACGDKLDLSIYKENPYVDFCWSKDKNVLKAFVEKHSIKYAIDVLDPEMAIFLTSIGIQVIYIDSLPFMWSKSDIIPCDVAYYCAQKYPEYSLNPILEKVKNLIWVDPIITVENRKTINDYIVINFGGLHSPFGDGREYFEMILKRLLPLLPSGEVFISGGRRVVELTKELFPELSCRTYIHEDFLKLVSGSKLFFTSPGLTTIYETGGMDIKTIILPPQNLSQFYNALHAQKICHKFKILNWNREILSMSYLTKFKDRPEEETVTYIYEQIKTLSKDVQYLEEFSQDISNMMQNNFTVNSNMYFEGNGVKDVSKILQKVMEEKYDNSWC